MGDLHAFDIARTAWAELSAEAKGVRPAARYQHGFTSMGGKLYVFRGVGNNGKE
jgi:hypothetical protein